MIKWFRLTQHQYVGLFALGFAFFILQELPYLIMPLIPLTSNPLMEMEDSSFILNAIEKVLGVSCILAMVFIVRDDAKWFSLASPKEKCFFSMAMLSIAGYFIGWIFYFNGIQSLPFILCTLVALPPIYYTFIGLWRRNTVLSALGVLFLIAHISNVWNNLS